MKKIIILSLILILSILLWGTIDFSCGYGGNIFYCDLLPKLIILLNLFDISIIIFVKISNKFIKTKNVLIIALLILLASIFYLSKNSYGHYSRFKLEPSKFACFIASDTRRDFCYDALALKYNDEKYCEKSRSWKSTQSNCFHELAKINLDISLCDKIDPAGLLKGWCYMDIAILTKNHDICDMIPLGSGATNNNIEQKNTIKACHEKINELTNKTVQ